MALVMGVEVPAMSHCGSKGTVTEITPSVTLSSQARMDLCVCGGVVLVAVHL